MDYHVYVIGPASDTTFEHSYVGVTNDLNRRWKSHAKSPYKIGQTIRENGWDQSIMRVIFTGSDEECFLLEEQLRPEPNMGLNTASGGHGGFTSYTAERNKKISMANKGRKNTWITTGTFKDRDYSSEKNPNAKRWLLTSSSGEEYELRGNLTRFCKEKDLLETCLRRHTGTVVPAPNFSGYGGFRAKNETSLRRRLNTTGWRLQLLS